MIQKIFTIMLFVFITSSISLGQERPTLPQDSTEVIKDEVILTPPSNNEVKKVTQTYALNKPVLDLKNIETGKKSNSRFYYRTEYSIWGFFHMANSDNLQCNYAGLAGLLRQQSDLDDPYFGVELKVAKSNFKLRADKNILLGEETTLLKGFSSVGTGLDMRGYLSLNFSSDVAEFNSTTLRVGALKIEQNSSDNTGATSREKYTSVIVDANWDLSRDDSRTAFSRTQFGFSYEYPFLQFMEITLPSGITIDGKAINRKHSNFYLETSVLSFPFKNNWAFVVSGRFDYNHYSDGLSGGFLSRSPKDVYGGLAIVSVYFKNNEILRGYYGEALCPALNKSIVSGGISLDALTTFRAFFMKNSFK